MRVGVLGGGQLGRMLALAGHPLGHTFTFLDPASDPPMAAVARGIRASFDDPAAREELARASDVLTFEFENVSFEAARWLSQRVPLMPSLRALEAKRDRLSEKQLFASLGIPTARYKTASTAEEFARAVEELGFPTVVKTRSQGYDGKGQAVLRDPRHLQRVWEALRGAPLLLESFVPFDRELSILAVRALDGSVRSYPLVENHHTSGILRNTLAPADGVDSGLQSQAERFAGALLEHLRYVGVLALELFQVGDRLLANEFAPRVHNSGHWTIEGAWTSQFSNHVRAVTGMPLGDTRARGRSVMVNILGELPDLVRTAAVPLSSLHLYGKAPKPGRKLGHVTLLCTGESPAELASFDASRRELLSLVDSHLAAPPLAPPPTLPFPA